MKIRTLLPLLLLTIGCLLGSCSDNGPDPRPQAGRTVLAYFALANGDKINSDIKSNIADMYRGLAQMDQQCTLLIYWDGTENDNLWGNPCLLKYETDGYGHVNGIQALNSDNDILQAATVIKDYALQNSTDSEVMLTVLRDMKAASSVHKYGLIMGAHGSGWLKHLDGSKSRSIGQDNDGLQTIEIPQLADVLTRSNLGKLDFLVFDACMMGNAETLYELRANTRYAITSPVETVIYGYPYDEILPLLYSESTHDYTHRVVDACVADQQNMTSGWCALAAIDCQALGQLAGVMRQQLAAHADRIPYCHDADLQQYCRKDFRYSSTDMLDFVAVLNDGNIPADFQEAFDQVVIHKGITTPCRVVSSLLLDPEHFSGLGMYIPKGNASAWNDYFSTSIAWSRDAGWTHPSTAQ